MKPTFASNLGVGDRILASWNGAGPVEVVAVIRIEDVPPTWIELRCGGNRIFMVEKTATLIKVY